MSIPGASGRYFVDHQWGLYYKVLFDGLLLDGNLSVDDALFLACWFVSSLAPLPPPLSVSSGTTPDGTSSGVVHDDPLVAIERRRRPILTTPAPFQLGSAGVSPDARHAERPHPGWGGLERCHQLR